MIDAKLQNVELPPMPQVVSKILQIEENRIDVSSDQLQALIAVDPALTSKILKIANSAFYARAHKVTSLSQAITMLGFKTIKSLTLLISTATLFPKHRRNNKVQKELWMRSVLSALIAKIVSEQCGRRNHKDEAFMAALLRDMGMMVLNNQFSEKFGMIFFDSDNGLDLQKIRNLETKEFGTTSPDISVMAMQKWNFPPEFMAVANLPTLDTDVAIDENNQIALPVLLANILVILGGYSEMVKNLSDNWRAFYTNLFERYSEKLNIDARGKTFLLNELRTKIAEDSFFSFCEELFSM